MKLKQYVGYGLYSLAKHLPVSYGKGGKIWKRCRGGGNKVNVNEMWK